MIPLLGLSLFYFILFQAELFCFVFFLSQSQWLFIQEPFFTQKSGRKSKEITLKFKMFEKLKFAQHVIFSDPGRIAVCSTHLFFRFLQLIETFFFRVTCVDLSQWQQCSSELTLHWQRFWWKFNKIITMTMKLHVAQPYMIKKSSLNHRKNQHHLNGFRLFVYHRDFFSMTIFFALKF